MKHAPVSDEAVAPCGDSRDTPVAFFVFKRPEQTARVFAQIRAWQPRRLLVVADGPRFPEETDACERTRALATAVDWPCEVETCFARANMGCRRRLSSGITWVFTRVEEAVILEDDCLPHPDFLKFCSAMLHAHREDRRVMMVTGTNLAGSWHEDRQDFHFSLYGSIWGWATWRRAWAYYDVEAKRWHDPQAKEAVRGLFPHDEAEARTLVFDMAAGRKVDTWDYQWTLARLLQSGLCVVPARNLIRNIGFGAGATHTSASSDHANVSVFAHPPPYRPASVVIADRQYDRFLFEHGGCGAGGSRGPVQRIGQRAALEWSRMRHLFSSDWRKL